MRLTALVRATVSLAVGLGLALAPTPTGIVPAGAVDVDEVASEEAAQDGGDGVPGFTLESPVVVIADDARGVVGAMRRAPRPVVSLEVAAPVHAHAHASLPAVAEPAEPAEPASRAVAHHLDVGRRALARLRHVDPAALGWEVRFHPGRAGYLGLADWEERVIHVWVRDHHDVSDVLGTLAHEVAHVYDYEHWTPAVRQGWLDLRGLDIAWWPDCTCDDRGFGAGDIAEALVVLEAGAGEWTGHFGMPTRAQLDWLLARL